MPRPLLLVACSISASLLFADPASHPERPDRLVETRAGFSIEYSPGDEAYMEAAFEALEPHLSSLAAPPNPPEPGEELPLSVKNMRSNREEILSAVAASIGLEQPTPAQGTVYDTFLAYYDQTGLLAESIDAMRRNFEPEGASVWRKDSLIDRLQSGGKVQNFSYNATTGKLEFELSFDTSFPDQDRVDCQKSVENVPPVITSKRATSSVVFSWVLGLFGASLIS